MEQQRARRQTRRRHKHSQLPTTQATGPVSKRKIPPYEILSDDDLDKIETQADWILEKIGVAFPDDPIALDFFQSAGANVKKEIVRFEPGHIAALCKTAPRQFELKGRIPEHNVTIGDDHVVLMPGYGSPFVTDLKNGRRYATLKDFENFIKLSHVSPHLHHTGGTVVEPTDIPVNKRHLDMTYAHLSLSTKPFMGAVTTAAQARDSLAMTEIVFGDLNTNNVVIQANINVNSPLVYDGNMSGSLRAYAERGQCVCVSPAIFGGAMGPVTPAAMIAQTHAEAMVGIALTQLIRPACPVVYGSFHSTMSLKSGALTFGTPEANLVTLGLGQMARRHHLPCRAGGGAVTAANTLDAQAGQDSTAAMLTSLLAGSHQVWHAAGWLEGGLTMGYEKFISDLDLCGHMLRFIAGIEVDRDALSPESYLEAGIGQNFLSTTHTLANFATANFEPAVPAAGAFEQWAENGFPSFEGRAEDVLEAMLASYHQPNLPKDTNEQLLNYISKKKRDTRDAWF